MYSWSSLLVQVYICKFAYYLKFITPKSILAVCCHSWICAKWQKNSHPTYTFPTEVKQGNTAFSFQLSYCKQVSFSQSLFSATFFTFLCFVGGYCVKKWPPSISQKCWLVFLSAQKAVMCLMEKTHIFAPLLKRVIVVLAEV